MGLHVNLMFLVVQVPINIQYCSFGRFHLPLLAKRGCLSWFEEYLFHDIHVYGSFKGSSIYFSAQLQSIKDGSLLSKVFCRNFNLEKIQKDIFSPGKERYVQNYMFMHMLYVELLWTYSDLITIQISKIYNLKRYTISRWLGLGLSCLTQHSTFQLYGGGKFYWRRKPEYPEIPTTAGHWQTYRRTDNTMAKGKRTKGQTTITMHKTLHRKVKFEQHEPRLKGGVKLMYSGRASSYWVIAPLVVRRSSCCSRYKPGDKSWLRKGTGSAYDKWNISLINQLFHW